MQKPNGDSSPEVAEPAGTPGSDQPTRWPLRCRGWRLDNAIDRFHAAKSMSAPSLFPEPTDPFTRPLANLEPHVIWLQRSTRPEAVAARAHINAWYRDFPDSGGKLAAKLTSTDDEVHQGAVDELYVHHCLREIEPDVRYEEGGQGPDFRVYYADHQILAVEVLSFFLRSDWAKEAHRHDELTDRLNKAFQPQGYLLDADVLRQDQGRNLPLKDLTLAAGAFLKGLPDPQVTTAAYGAGQPLPWVDFVRDGIHIRFRAMPMEPDAGSLTDPDTRIMATGAAIGGLVDSGERLKDRLNGKRKKPYTLDPDVPFLLAVGNHDPFCGDLEFLIAMYGLDWEAMIGVHPPLWQNQPKFSGFFGIGMGERPYNTRFSAVGVIDSQTPQYDLTNLRWLLFDNPHARVRLPDGLLPTTRRFQASNGGTWGWQAVHPPP
jgi:hypothetical protein